MAPTTSPILEHSPSSPSRHLHRLRRQGLDSSHHPPRRPSRPRTEQSIDARTLDATLQPSVLDGPLPPPIAPTPSESAVLVPEPSAIPVGNNQPQGPSQSVDVSGNIIAAVIVIVLILGGLIGLVVGGEMLRRRASTTREKVSPFPPGHRKPEPIKNATGLPRQRTQMNREKFPYDEKTLTPLTRPPPALNRERHRRLSDVWPIRNLSRTLCNRRSCPEQDEHTLQLSPPTASPQTTWSEFSPVLPYVAPPRTVLACIPEELEECQSQTDSDIVAILGLQRLLESGSVVSTPQTNQPESPNDMFLDVPNGLESSVGTARCGQDCRILYKRGTKDEDTKSLGSSAPDMTSDEGESSRSSIASLESLQGGNKRESIREEVFELKRAQTTSMQMNKGVLLSLSFKNLDDSENIRSTHRESDLSRSPSVSDAGDKDYVERELSLAMLGVNFSAVNLDEFPSPPSILPMIPSFVSSF